MGDIWFPPYYLYVDPLVGSCLPSRQATLSLPESYQTKLSPSCQRDCNNKDWLMSGFGVMSLAACGRRSGLRFCVWWRRMWSV